MTRFFPQNRLIASTTHVGGTKTGMGPTQSALKIGILILGFITALSWAEQASSSDNQKWMAPARAAAKKNPVAADEKSVSRGKALYIQACVVCHGSQGKGDGTAAPSLEKKPANHTDPKMWECSDGDLFWKITNGKGAMPSWESAYSEEQRWDLVNFIRTLAPKPDKK